MIEIVIAFGIVARGTGSYPIMGKPPEWVELKFPTCPNPRNEAFEYSSPASLELCCSLTRIRAIGYLVGLPQAAPMDYTVTHVGFEGIARALCN